MDIRKSRTCEKCKTAVPLDQVRLYPKPSGGNLLLCNTCLNATKKNQREPSIPTKTAKLPAADHVAFQCGRCKYQFRVDENKANVTYNLHCPYCGKSDKLTRR